MYFKRFFLFLLPSLLTVSAQNVGIGTNTPQEKLHVAGTTRINSLATATTPSAVSDKVTWTDNNGTMYAFPTGAVGKVLGINPSGIIAWINPTPPMDAANGLYYNSGAGKIYQGGTLLENTTITQGNFSYIHSLNGTGIWEARNSATAGNGLYVNTNDKVGIGTASPLDKLHISGTGNTLRIGGVATGGAFLTNTTATSDRLLYTNTNGQVTALPNGSNEDILQINTSGIVNWAAPTFWKLTGNTAISAPTIPVMYGTSAFLSNENWIGTTDANALVIGTSNKERMRVNTDGSIAIGLSTSGDATELVTINSVGTKTYPLNAYTSNATAAAIWAENLAASGTSNGVGVYGGTTQSSGAGIWGANAHQNGAGLIGQNTAAANTGTGNGVFGSTAQSSGGGVKGQNAHIDGDGVVGINTAGTNTGNGTGVIGQANQSAGAGVWGQNLNNIGFGVYGVNIAAANTNQGIGVFGGTAQSNGAGLWGQNANANGTAVIGINTALSGSALGNGVYGQTSQKSTFSGVVAGVYGWCNGSGASDFGFPRASVYGDGSATGSYACGVFGDGGTSIRSGGVMGDNYALGRGALGYIAASGTGYSVYGFGGAYQTGLSTGRMANPGETQANEPNNHVGLGIYGGVMGGWVRGLQYGFHTKGEEYSLYVDGQSITNRPAIQLLENEEKRVVSYTPSSLTADVYVRGTSALKNGSTYIVFDAAFQATISAELPLNITVTPMGESQGVYVTDITTTGFRVVENNHGNAAVSFNWLAMATRKGYENPAQLSETILSNNFDAQMNGVMFNDNNPSDADAVGIYYDGQAVQLGKTPASFETQRLENPRLLRHTENHAARTAVSPIPKTDIQPTETQEVQKGAKKPVKGGSSLEKTGK